MTDTKPKPPECLAMSYAKPKPCPFCGTGNLDGSFRLDTNGIVWSVAVSCWKCGASGPWSRRAARLVDAKVAAIEAWNKVPQQSDVDAAYSNGHADGLSECESGAYNE